MQPDGSGSETSPLPVTQSVGPGHIPLFIEHLLLGGTELGAAPPHRRALASLSLGGLSYKTPPTPAHHPSRATARDGGGGVAVHTPGPCGYLASGSKLFPHLMIIKGLTEQCGDVESWWQACPAARSTCSGHRDGSTGPPCLPEAPFPGFLSPGVPLRGGGTLQTSLLLGVSQKAWWDLSKARGRDAVSSGSFQTPAEGPASLLPVLGILRAELRSLK